MTSLLHFFLLLCASSYALASAVPSGYLNGVNLGSWLVYEPWMASDEWLEMGGERCDNNCTLCPSTEGDLTEFIGQSKANKVFKKHRQTWFCQSDIDDLLEIGVNSVRIPIGWWLFESLKQEDEKFPEGVIFDFLRGMKQLKAAGISVIIDLHALPGVSSYNSMFAGKCVNIEDLHFYEPKNYARALIWHGVMTALIHLHPAFTTTFGIEAMNEPDSNSTLTVGLQGYYHSFVQIVRAVEVVLDVKCTDVDLAGGLNLTSADTTSLPAVFDALPELEKAIGGRIAFERVLKATFEQIDLPLTGLAARLVQSNVIQTATSVGVGITASHSNVSQATTSVSVPALRSSVTHATKRVNTSAAASHSLARRHDSPLQHSRDHKIDRLRGQSKCLATVFMERGYQYTGDTPADGALAAIGPALYDQHRYFRCVWRKMNAESLSFGGTAPNATIDSYVETACTLNATASNAPFGNLPLLQGEWWVATQFEPTVEDLQRFGDAQRFNWKEVGFRGTYYWNFKVRDISATVLIAQLTSKTVGESTRQSAARDLVRSVRAGFVKSGRSGFFDPHICAPYPKPNGPELDANGFAQPKAQT